MRFHCPVSAQYRRPPSCSNIIQIQNGTFHRQGPSGSKGSRSPLFSNLYFSLPALPIRQDTSNAVEQEHWAVIGANGAATFLEILRGHHICAPPNARSYPYLSSNEIEAKDYRLRSPSRAIQHVGFTSSKSTGGSAGIRGSYLSARYESRREETDWSLMQYLRGEMELNPSKKQQSKDTEFDLFLSQVINNLRLDHLISASVGNLSNGQIRRAAIAKALLDRPEVLLLEEPFMGLDPPTLVSLSPMLRGLAYRSSPRLFMSLRPQDPIPDWITHLAILGTNNKLALAGCKTSVLFATHRWTGVYESERGRTSAEMARQMTAEYGQPPIGIGQTLSSGGIDELMTSSTILSSTTPSYVQSNGEMAVEHLDSADMEMWREASGKPRHEASIDDLLVLTCSLPKSFKAGNRKIPVEHQALKIGLTEKESPFLDPTKLYPTSADSIIELNSVIVSYGSKTVLGQGVQHGFSTPGLNLVVRQGTRLALVGPNGSGKTTLLSLITSDHPQSYSLPIKFYDRPRLPSPGQPGVSFWEIQARTGHSSPEVHAFFPKRLTIRRTLESAWAETFVAKPELSDKSTRLVDAFLGWWEPELDPSYRTLLSPKPSQCGIEEWSSASYPPLNYAQHTATQFDWANSHENSFGTLSFQSQRLLLFLRAIIKGPDVVVLDEAFSGLSPLVRDKALLFLEAGQKLVPRQETANIYSQGNERANSETNWKKIENQKAEVEHTGLKTNFTIQDLDPASECLSADTKERSQQLRSKTIGQLSAMTITTNETPTSSSFTIIDPLFTGLTSKQALIVVSHVREEIPAVIDQYLRLPGEDEIREHGRVAKIGRCDGGSIRAAEGWSRLWGLGSTRSSNSNSTE